MVDVDHGDHEPLLLLTLTHQDCQTPFRDVLRFLLLLVVAVALVVVKMKLRHMDVEIQAVFVYTHSHLQENPESRFKTLLFTKTSSGLLVFPRGLQENNGERPRVRGRDGEVEEGSRGVC